ncbi:MAG: outer membrane protein assembly factor BamE [Flavobacterium sp.]
MKFLIVTTILLFNTSCLHYKPKDDFVDENFSLKNIKIGMTKVEVVQIIGAPKDSIEMYNHENVYRKIYVYNTNNFSGYSLNVVFNKEEIVNSVNMD